MVTTRFWWARVVMVIVLMALVVGTPRSGYLAPSSLITLHTDASSGNGVAASIYGYSIGAVQVVASIGFDRTITWEVSSNATDYVALACRAVGGTTYSTTTTSGGIYHCPFAAASSFRARLSGGTTGTATITLRMLENVASAVAPASGGGGGGDVSVDGSPSNGEIATWVSADTIKGEAATGSGSPVRQNAPTLSGPLGLVKADVGLNNVDNTADATKNVATAVSATTAGALSANPAPCDANKFTTDIAANGTLTCNQPTIGNLVIFTSAAFAAQVSDIIGNTATGKIPLITRWTQATRPDPSATPCEPNEAIQITDPAADCSPMEFCSADGGSWLTRCFVPTTQTAITYAADNTTIRSVRYGTAEFSTNFDLCSDSNIKAHTGTVGITATLPALTDTTCATDFHISIDTGTGTLTLAPRGTDLLNTMNNSQQVVGAKIGMFRVRSKGTFWQVESTGNVTGTGGGDALTTDPLSQFALTTSTQLRSIITDAVGTGGLLFATALDGLQTALGYTPLNPANNLSDVNNAATARSNLSAQLNVGVTAKTGSGTEVPGTTTTSLALGDVLCYDTTGTTWKNCEPGIPTRAFSGGTTDSLVTADKGKLVTFSHTADIAVDIAAAGSAGFDALWNAQVCNINSGVVTIDPASTVTIGGSLTLVLYKGDCALIKSDGTNYQTVISRDSVEVQLVIFDFTTDITTGDGKYYFLAGATGSKLIGKVLAAVQVQVITAGTTNTTDIQIAKCSQAATGNACSGTVVDVLSTKSTIDSGENTTATAATPAVINTSNDDIAAGDILRIDQDAVSTTAPKGEIVHLIFRRP